MLSASNYTVSATVNDKAGNPGSASHNLAVDTTAPVLTINTVAGDDIINDAEHGQALVISGTSTGGEAGDVVSVVLNGKTYTTTWMPPATGALAFRRRMLRHWVAAHRPSPPASAIGRVTAMTPAAP